jgi:hypothetical protein
MRKLDEKEEQHYIELLKRRLENIDVFKDPPGLVKKLVDKNKVDLRLYDEDEIIITQFSEAHEFYLILNGAVRAYDTSRDKPLRLNSLTEGNFFGERSLLLHQPRAANVQAVTNTYLACFNIKAWDLLEKKFPAVLAYFWEVEQTYELTVTKPFPDSQKAIRYYSCFISYSSNDQEFGERLYADLRHSGVKCWYAPEDMKIGAKIRDTIYKSIRLYDKLLIILSENSLSSAWVESEVEKAFEEERKRKQPVLFPIRLDEVVMQTTQAWATEIRRTRHIGDFSRWEEHDAYQQALERLLQDLKAEG